MKINTTRIKTKTLFPKHIIRSFQGFVLLVLGQLLQCRPNRAALPPIKFLPISASQLVYPAILTGGIQMTVCPLS